MSEAAFVHEHILGTRVEVRIEGVARGVVRAAVELVDCAVVDELSRLERVFSVFDPESELRRWGRGELSQPGPELCEALGLAVQWMKLSDGAFNPLTGVVMEQWQNAEASQSIPDHAEFQRLANTIAEPRFVISDGVPIQLGDCTHVNLNAFAKGLIVDRALRLGWVAAAEIDATALIVNAGGDLAHIGKQPVRVGIENPLRPYDNEPALCHISIANSAMASSGNARRGYNIGGTRYGHVIDPRTGWPANELASVTALARCAATADVLATSASVLSAEHAIAHLESFAGVSGFIVEPDGTTRATRNWPTD